MTTRITLATSTAMALGLAFLAVPAIAQDVEKPVHLGQVILGYTTDGTPIYAGENTTSIDTDDLMLTGGANAVETVLREQTSVFTQQDIGNPGIAVNIRGFEGSGRVAMSVDGIPQNFRLTGHSAQGMTYVDSNLLSTIDITRGAVTTVGGSGFAGSVNFRTLSTDDVIRGDKPWGVLSRLSYGDNANAKSGMIGVAYDDTKFSTLFAASRSLAGDYKDGNGDTIAKSKENINSQLLKLGYDFQNGHEISLSAMRYASDFYAASYDQELTNRAYTLGYKYDARDGIINLEANAYSGKTETEWVCCNNPPYANSAGRIMSTKTTGFNLTNVSEVSLGAWSLVSVNGVDVSKDTLGGKSGGVNPISGEAKRNAIFTENIFSNGPWEVTAGLRYSRYKLNDTNGEINVKHNAAAPKLSVAYQATDALQPYVTLSRTSRDPSAQEVMLGGMSHSGGSISNPELKPEVSTGYELGFNVEKAGLFTSNDSLTGRVNYYKMDVKDYVVAQMGFVNSFGDRGSAFVNIPGTSKTAGLEVQLDYAIANYNFGIAYTKNNNKLPSQIPGLGAGQYLPDSTLSLKASTHVMDDKLELGAKYDYVSGGLYTARYQTQAVKRDTSYELFDLFAIYDVTDNFSVNARIENVFDKAYIPWLSSDENGPGRSVYFGGEVRF